MNNEKPEVKENKQDVAESASPSTVDVAGAVNSFNETAAQLIKKMEELTSKGITQVVEEAKAELPKATPEEMLD